MADKLSLLEESSDYEEEFKINKDYADRYDVWRNKEELQKYKDLKKEEDSESSSESEVEVPEVEEEFFRVISLLRSKDPRVYEKDFVAFKDKEVEKKPKTVKQKPIYMKEYERNLVLERGGKFSDEDEEHIPAKGPAYYKEQEEIKKGFIENSHANDNDDDLLGERTKTKKKENEEAEADYIKWLKGEDNEISEERKKDLSYLRNYWNDPNLDEDEKFLSDYFLNKRYVAKDDDIPSYEEITSGFLSDDERILEEQEQFEHKYNFRFEEPDEEFIKRYPRIVEGSVRRTDNRRKEKREEKAERKKREKEQRKEELKRLKALKRREIEEKFMKIKEIVGEESLNLNESDIESDFDPDKHDQKMREMFNDDYYQVEEQQKPEFSYDEELDSENWNTWTRDKSAKKDEAEEEESIAGVVTHGNEERSEDAETNATRREEFEKEMINACLPRKKARKKSLFAKVISQPKPLYDPDGKSFDEYLDEYYKLDYEDVVGDLPVRYRYRKVVPNDFGLTVDEILTADDRELNRWCSVKKTCQYRNDDEELYDVQAFKRKAENLPKKKKLLSSIYAPKEVDDTDNFSSNTVKKNDVCGMTNKVPGEEGYSEEDKNKSNVDLNIEQEVNEDSCVSQSLKKKSKKRKKSKQSSLCIESESKNSEVENERKNADNESRKDKSLFESYSQENNNFIAKSSKRKKVEYENTFETSSADSLHAERQTIHNNSIYSVSDNQDSNLVSNNSTENNANKKKKKKKHSTQGAISDNTTQEIDNRNTSNVHYSKFSESNMKHVPQEKRLGLSDEDSCVSQSLKKKSKKREKSKQNSLYIESESKNSEVENEQKNADNESGKDKDLFESFNSQENNNFIAKSSKRKRAEYENTFENSSAESLHEERQTIHNRVCSASNNQESNLVSNNFTENNANKKKRKKKKRNHSTQGTISDNTTQENEKGNTSNVHSNKFSKSNMKHVSQDKRLGLSDERLAAYGINPKKFKNKIIYSKR